MPTDNIKIIFVYNADSGLFNTVTDIAHKIFSPQTYSCGLCALTHSYFSMRDEWKSFIESLGTGCCFMHRDEFLQEYNNENYQWPAVFVEKSGQLDICLDSNAIDKCDNLNELKTLIRESCL